MIQETTWFELTTYICFHISVKVINKVIIVKIRCKSFEKLLNKIKTNWNYFLKLGN